MKNFSHQNRNKTKPNCSHWIIKQCINIIQYASSVLSCLSCLDHLDRHGALCHLCPTDEPSLTTTMMHAVTLAPNNKTLVMTWLLYIDWEQKAGFMFAQTRCYRRPPEVRKCSPVNIFTGPWSLMGRKFHEQDVKGKLDALLKAVGEPWLSATTGGQIMPFEREMCFDTVSLNLRLCYDSLLL